VRGEVLLSPADGGALPRPAHALVLRTVHDENARALRLLAGRADIAVNLVSPGLLPALAMQPGLSVASRAGANLTYLVVHEQRAQLGDPRVRNALSLSIDRATVCATLFDGRAHPASGLIAPASWAHAHLPPLPFAPAEARTLLAQAGASAVHLELLTSTERFRQDVARLVAQEFMDVGVRVDVVPLELGTMIARLNAGEFDLASLQLPEMSEPNVLRHFLHSAFLPPVGANRGRVHDETLDSLLDDGAREHDVDRRRAIYERLEWHEREAMHIVPLWYEDQVVVTNERARGFLPSAEGRWLSAAGIQ
jgi:peptide/nickel transport system substrate-binding protein